MAQLNRFWVYFILLAVIGCSDGSNSANVSPEVHFVKNINLSDNNSEIQLSIEGMSCAVNCASKIQKTLADLPGVEACTVNFEDKVATVQVSDKNKVSHEDLTKAVTDIHNGQYKVTKVVVHQSTEPASLDKGDGPESNSSSSESEENVELDGLEFPSIFGALFRILSL